MKAAEIDAIRLWCRERTPQEEWHRRRIEALVTGRHIDLERVEIADGVERRATFARLRYLHTGRWHLYWRDADGTFQIYRSFPPVDEVREILDFLESDPDPLFWAELDGD